MDGRLSCITFTEAPVGAEFDARELALRSASPDRPNLKVREEAATHFSDVQKRTTKVFLMTGFDVLRALERPDVGPTVFLWMGRDRFGPGCIQDRPGRIV